MQTKEHMFCEDVTEAINSLLLFIIDKIAAHSAHELLPELRRSLFISFLLFRFDFCYVFVITVKLSAQTNEFAPKIDVVVPLSNTTSSR